MSTVSLAASIRKFINLSDEEMDQIQRRVQYQPLKRREILTRLGEVSKNIYFVESGCIRYYQIVAGEEVTGQFFFEGGWYTDMESFLHQQPSNQCAQAIEASNLAFLSKKDLYELYEEVPKFERFGRLMAENAFIGLRKKTDQLSLLSAEERYLDLLKTRPKVVERIPQHYIASYLGIKPQSLSRIRKRLAS